MRLWKAARTPTTQVRVSLCFDEACVGAEHVGVLVQTVQGARKVKASAVLERSARRLRCRGWQSAHEQAVESA